MKRAMQNLTGSLLISLAPLASAQEDLDPVALQIASGFANLAGTAEDVLALVHAVHEGVPVRLTSTAEAKPQDVPEITLIEPPTGKMSWNDVKMALMLTRDALQRFGITRPTGEQLQAVLTGGELAADGKNVTLRGVLQMRAEGMNWGRIAAERFRRAQVVNNRSQPRGSLAQASMLS